MSGDLLRSTFTPRFPSQFIGVMFYNVLWRVSTTVIILRNYLLSKRKHYTSSKCYRFSAVPSELFVYVPPLGCKNRSCRRRQFHWLNKIDKSIFSDDFVREKQKITKKNRAVISACPISRIATPVDIRVVCAKYFLGQRIQFSQYECIQF